jgi:CRISPR-associated protein Csx16
MTVYFISRHPGTRDWAEARGLSVECWVDHLDLDVIGPGDRVLGTLPVHLAAAVCERGARYVHLALELPASLRGRELTAADLDRFGARLEAYEVRRLSEVDGSPA